MLRDSASVYTEPGAKVRMTAWDVLLASPTGAEREEYGVPETPLAEDPLPALPSTPPDIHSDIETLVAACTFITHAALSLEPDASFFGDVIAEGWWTNVDCPTLLGSMWVKLYVKYQSSYQLMWTSPTQIIGPNIVGPPALPFVEAARGCSYQHSGTWKAVADTNIVSLPDTMDRAEAVGIFPCHVYPPECRR